LDLIPIPGEAIWPEFPSSLTSTTDTSDRHYLKRASLLCYEADGDQNEIPELVLKEAHICEILLNNPHPNIAKYWGCRVIDGRIHGLVFDKYPMTLQQRVKKNTPIDTEHCIQGIKDGIRHIHSLGLTHNDINPHNVMLDVNDNPIIIDFDSCVREGEELDKCGTFGWCLDGMEFGSRENDYYGLKKIEEYLVKASQEDVGKEENA
jgi:serine/threonine protein kinase